MDVGAELFRRVVEASRDGLWILDASGMTVYANEQMARMLGRTPEEMVGFPAVEALGEELHGPMLDYFAALEVAPDDAEGGDNAEVELVRADGSRVWVLASHSPIRDDDGHRIGWLHRITDNTEPKALLDAVRERERLLAAAQSIARIGSWEWDVASDVVTWSDQLYRIYNVTPDEFEATYAAFLEFLHPEDRHLVEAAVASIFAGEDEFAWDGRVLPRGGTVRWVRGLGRVERDAAGNPVRMGGTAQDITERVESEHLAAEATRRLHLLRTMATAANQTNSLREAIELAAVGLPLYTGWLPVGVFQLDASGSLEPLVFESEDVPWALEPDEALAGRVRQSCSVEVAPAPGQETTHSLVGIPVLLDGRVTCVIELLADEVPPDENSRTLIDQVSQQLSQVAQREAAAVQLAEARDEAMEASRLKSEFLATMSHEIRTPMNGVIGLNDLLLRTDLDPHQRRLAEGLQGAGLTLLGIINDILDLSKIEAGKLELEEVDFDVRAVFDKCADVLHGAAHEKGVELVVACHPDVPATLRGDPGRLGQVLANLGSNAVKFTSAGEVAIRARAENGHADDEVVLRVDVSDTGVGIDPAQRPGLFDAFTQADPSTTREHGGTGLGLAISQQLVQALGGQIDVVSEPGRGSTFSFTARFGRTTGVRRPAAADPDALRGRRILVVDDNATNRLILEEQLSAWEMAPVLVGSAEEAMAAVRTATAAGEPFEVALLDLLLPDGDGVALARAIGAGTPGASPHLLLLSSGHHVDLAAARAAGISTCLTKPVRYSELFDNLQDAVARPTTTDATHEAVPTADGRGLRILVVEDNQVNQMVAVGLLEERGYTVDVAEDGLDAVAAVRPGHGYAAILMDCRMPRLDGFDATRRIRAQEPDGARVPIIAMTASALEGEEERCRESGMDDFLTKPVDPGRLVRVVRQWAEQEAARGVAAAEEPRVASASPADPAEPADPAGDGTVDLDRMRMLDEMRRDGSSLFERASANFVENAPGGLADIRAAVATNDPPALVASAHRLKGSATNLGLPALGEAAAVLEALGDAGRTDEAEGPLTELEAALDRALTALADLRTRGL